MFKHFELQETLGQQYFDPLCQEIKVLPVPVSGVENLTTLCRSAIIQTLTLSRIEEAASKLHLPHIPCKFVLQLQTRDFHISPLNLTAENYNRQVYPAICRITQDHVQLCVFDSHIPDKIQESPAFLLSFEETGKLMAVLEPTITLQSVLRVSRHLPKALDPNFIWQVIEALCKYITEQTKKTEVLNNNVYFLQPKWVKIKLGRRGGVFIDKNDRKMTGGGGDDWSSQEEQEAKQYQAPEVMGSTGFGIEQALVWSLGCILYEMLTLEPPGFSTQLVWTLPGACSNTLRSQEPQMVHSSCSLHERVKEELQRQTADHNLHALVKNCLMLKPSLRPDAKCILNMIEAHGKSSKRAKHR